MLRPMFDALDHVILAVRDLAGATRRYAHAVRAAALVARRASGQGTANTLFRLHNTYLELLAPEGDGPIGDARGAAGVAHGEGPLGLAFAHLRRAGRVTRSSPRAGSSRRPSSRASAATSTRGDPAWRTCCCRSKRTRGVLRLRDRARLAGELLPAAAPVRRTPVSGIDHAVVQTPDAEAAIALYRDGLGLRLALDRSFPDWGMRLVFLRVGGVTIELAQPLDGQRRDTKPRPALGALVARARRRRRARAARWRAGSTSPKCARAASPARACSA